MAKKDCKKGMVIIIAFVFFSIGCFLEPIQGDSLFSGPDYSVTTRTWFVDNEGDGDFNTIQDAINAAEDGDTIKVYSGTYYENLVIDKNNLVFTGLEFELGIGSDQGFPTVDGGYLGSCISIDADHVTLSYFNIMHCGNDSSCAGMKLYTNNHVITNNVFTKNNIGMLLFRSDESNIYDNIFNNGSIGIYIDKSNDNQIYNNDISYNTDGISIESSTYNTIRNNDLYQNNDNGIVFNFSWYTTIIENNVYENAVGISVLNSNVVSILQNSIYENSKGLCINLASNRNNISENNISRNMFEGIYISGSSTNVFYNNIINKNQNGFIGHTTTFNELLHNTVHNNQDNGIVLTSSPSNIIDHNDIISSRFKEGILLSKSDMNNITNNVISNAGISIYNSNENIMLYNEIDSSLNGIYLNSSNDNLLVENTITLCNFDGIYLSSCFNNRIYHNFIIDNQQSAFDNNGQNMWDNGYPEGGNYWSDFDESGEGAYDYFSGPNQTGFHSDGIVDTPYDIPGSDVQDRYPLMYPWGPPSKPMQPQGITQGIRGQEYRYSTVATDPNGDLIQYGWDWDGDKVVDEWTMQVESGQTVMTTHTWDTKGDYLIHVKAMDEYGGESEWSDPLAVSMPKAKTVSWSFLKMILERYLPVWLQNDLLY